MVKLPEFCLTARLELRPFRITEASCLAALLRDEAVIRWMPGAPLSCDDETAARMITRSQESFQQGRGLDRAIVRRCDQAVMGEVTLDLYTGELAYWLESSYWGRGYAREALEATLDEARRDPGLDTVLAYVLRGNLRSSRLLDRCGFQFAGLRADLPKREGMAWLEYRLHAINCDHTAWIPRSDARHCCGVAPPVRGAASWSR